MGSPIVHAPPGMWRSSFFFALAHCDNQVVLELWTIPLGVVVYAHRFCRRCPNRRDDDDRRSRRRPRYTYRWRDKYCWSSISVRSLRCSWTASLSSISVRCTDIPSLLLLHFVGKLACALAGCCYGALTTIPVSIPSEWSLSPLKGARIHPLQFEEAIAFFALLILSLVEVKRRCAPGKLVSLYFVGVGIERFLSIILRGDLRHTEQIIFQVFAFCTIIVGIVLSFGTPSTARITKTKHR
ncbi:MAG: hypothetical protein KatS3mg038_0649 [Candidatus Kapaibacterium sp.]|nr:MAG: hypothetical protein KatS3mg038_0649 [Candidatus Kapabacteria bacterium]GIV56973.1 MAG: hypothetical protein KatS3mg040_1741 [Candidatus Kapabacteria bacterium]